jgi:hypothetical protein
MRVRRTTVGLGIGLRWDPWGVGVEQMRTLDVMILDWFSQEVSAPPLPP